MIAPFSNDERSIQDTQQSSRSSVKCNCLQQSLFSPTSSVAPLPYFWDQRSGKFSRRWVARNERSPTSCPARSTAEVYLFPFRDEARGSLQIWSILHRPERSLEITKVTALKEARKSATRACESERRNMKTSTKDRIKGSFHEVKGTIREQVGKATNDRTLKAEGKAEKNVGKVQQRIGQAKETVAKLKGKLKGLKTA